MRTGYISPDIQAYFVTIQYIPELITAKSMPGVTFHLYFFYFIKIISIMPIIAPINRFIKVKFKFKMEN